MALIVNPTFGSLRDAPSLSPRPTVLDALKTFPVFASGFAISLFWV